MQSWYKKHIKNAQNEQVKTRKRQLFKNIQYNFKLSIVVFIYLTIFVLLSLVSSSNELGLVLAILSAIITICFEFYEWLFLFKKDKSQKHPLKPFLYSAILFTIWGISLYFIDYSNTDWNNLICSITLLLYIIFMTIRKTIEDFKK